MKRQFNGHEVAFLMGWTEGHDKDFTVEREVLGRRSDGYEHARVIVQHPDGNLYQFVVRYDDEHGIIPCREWPNELTEADEVEAFDVVITKYRIKESS
jgi:hypothetical protein